MKRLVLLFLLCSAPAFAQFNQIFYGPPPASGCQGSHLLGLDVINNVLYTCTGDATVKTWQALPSLFGANTWTGAQNVGQHIFLASAVCNDVVDNTAIIQNALNNAPIGATIELPSGTCKIATAVALVSGVSIVGQMPQVQTVAGQNPDGDMIPGNGTWLDCNGQTNCFTGSGLRGTNLQNLGFKNFTGQAILIGGNNVDGISFADWRGLIFIGSTTVNGSDTAVEVYNFQHLTWQNISAFDVNTCYHLINQHGVISGGNSVFIEPFCLTYAKTVANGNNSKPGLWLQALKAPTGSVQPFGVMTFIRPQVNSFGGDNTGVGVKLDSDIADGVLVDRVTIIGADVEGQSLDAIQLVDSPNNYIEIASGNSATYGVSLDATSSRNVIVSTDNTIQVDNQNGGGSLFLGSYTSQAHGNAMLGSYVLGAGQIYLSTTLLQTSATTLAGLPACGATFWGAMQAIVDSTTNTWGATITGGGSFSVLAYCDGTNWTVAAK